MGCVVLVVEECKEMALGGSVEGYEIWCRVMWKDIPEMALGADGKKRETE